MTMLVTLDDMKNHLDIPLVDTTYDVFLTDQITIISDAIEGYCGRKFLSASYTQTYYKDEMVQERIDKLVLFHYPVSVITSVTDTTQSILLDPSDIRFQPDRGFLKRIYDGRKITWFNSGEETIAVVYTAGFATVPTPLTHVVYTLVSANYNKELAGVSLDFGNDVQSISIPGTLTVNFDYTLQANERASSYGMIIGNYANVLDPYRSERVVIGSIEDYYVQ